MKIGTENKTKTIVASVLLVLALVMLYRWISGAGQEGFPSAPATRTPVAANTTTPMPHPAQSSVGAKPVAKSQLLAQTLDPTLRFDLLKTSEDVTYKGAGRDIFRSQAEPPKVAKIPEPVQSAMPAAPPPPPPINLKFYGFAGRKDGYKRIFLSQGEDIFVAKEGDIVDRRYRIVKINANSVDVEDVLTNNRQTLPLTTS